MNDQLETLISNLSSYRNTLDRAFTPGINTPEEARSYFLNVLISVSRLYLDYVLLVKASPTFKTTRSNKCNSNTGKQELGREMRQREKFRMQLEAWTS